MLGSGPMIARRMAGVLRTLIDDLSERDPDAAELVTRLALSSPTGRRLLSTSGPGPTQIATARWRHNVAVLQAAKRLASDPDWADPTDPAQANVREDLLPEVLICCQALREVERSEPGRVRLRSVVERLAEHARARSRDGQVEKTPA